MNVNPNRRPRPSRMLEAPGTRTAVRPAEVLAVLRPTGEEPQPIIIGGLWKTDFVPRGTTS